MVFFIFKIWPIKDNGAKKLYVIRDTFDKEES